MLIKESLHGEPARRTFKSDGEEEIQRGGSWEKWIIQAIPDHDARRKKPQCGRNHAKQVYERYHEKERIGHLRVPHKRGIVANEQIEEKGALDKTI